jgi:hypothetical protein
METIKRYFANPIIAGSVGFVLGLIIGLVVLGWWLFPVQWTDASPADLYSEAKDTYLRTCIDAYGYNGNSAAAKSCYDSLGADAPQVLQKIVMSPEPQDKNLVTAFANVALSPAAAAAVVQPGQVGTPAPGQAEQPLAASATPAAAKAARPAWFGLLCGGFIIVLFIVGALWLLTRFGILKLDKIFKPSASGKNQQENVDYDTGDVPPISRNMASYQLGNDLFDEVYSIESNGDFMGEYGVAIADFTGVGGPKKVSAFEVWLFDKSNIPTTTKVLMSEQAFADNNRRQKLEAKGETLLAERDRPVVLETNSLRLAARIVDMSYGQGASGSYFERFVLELKVWQLEG